MQQWCIFCDDAVEFANITTRLPTPEEIELILQFHANTIINDEIRFGELSENLKEEKFLELVNEYRVMFTATSSVVEFADLNLRMVTVHEFSIGHTTAKSNYCIETATYRYIIRENNTVENFDMSSYIFDI
jgi:hypothetical protein